MCACPVHVCLHSGLCNTSKNIVMLTMKTVTQITCAASRKDIHAYGNQTQSRATQSEAAREPCLRLVAKVPAASAATSEWWSWLCLGFLLRAVVQSGLKSRRLMQVAASLAGPGPTCFVPMTWAEAEAKAPCTEP